MCCPSPQLNFALILFISLSVSLSPTSLPHYLLPLASLSHTHTCPAPHYHTVYCCSASCHTHCRTGPLHLIARPCTEHCSHPSHTLSHRPCTSLSHGLLSFASLSHTLSHMPCTSLPHRVLLLRFLFHTLSHRPWSSLPHHLIVLPSLSHTQCRTGLAPHCHTI